MVVYKEDLLELIKERFGDLNNNSGCYLNGVWFSIYEIVSVINKYNYDEIDKDDLFGDLENKYGRLDNESGCYLNGKWISMAVIYDLIEKCSN